MKVVVIGAGISGVTTAYFLSRAGCEVTVVERERGAANSTSFANGGVVGGTQVDPWAQPGLPLKLLGWLGRENAPVLVRLREIPNAMDWGRRFLANCTVGAVNETVKNNVRLTLFSLKMFAELREAEAMSGVEYDLSRKGAFKLYFTPEAFEHACRSVETLRASGVEAQAISGTSAAELEPALWPVVGRLAGVIAYPNEEIGDCRKFTQWLAERCTAAGVRFLYDTEVSRLRVEGGYVAAAVTSKGDVEADNFVAAQASHTPGLLRPLNVRLPVIPVKGVSITVPARPWKDAVQSAIMDHSRLFGLIRIGERLRISGSAEITGFNSVPSRARCQALIESVLQIFPDFAACLAAGEPLLWAGLRGNTPDGAPVLGRTPIANLFVNVGHGPQGWSTSCGAAKLVAAVVTGAEPEIAMRGLEITRFN